MTDWLIYFCLFSEVITLSKINSILFGRWITPFSLISIPYTIVVGIVFIFAQKFSFIPLYMESVLVWIFGLFLFWIGGVFVALVDINAIRHAIKVQPQILYEDKFEMHFLIVSWITIVIMATKLWLSIISVGGIQFIGGRAFAEIYGIGWVGHVMDFSKLLLIFYIGTAKKEKMLQIITSIIIIFMILPYQSKGSIMLPLISGLIYRVLSGKTTIHFGKIIVYFGIICLLFVMSYFIGYGGYIGEALYNIDNYKFLAYHFLSYVFSGVLAFGDVIRSGITIQESDKYLIFAPILNIYAVFTSGNIVSIVTDYFSDISYLGKDSNVHTLFGTLFMFLGHFGFIVYIFIFSLIINTFFAIAVTTKNCWFLSVFSLMAGGLIFGWFEFYYWSLTMYEVPVYGIILAHLVKPNRKSIMQK
jgi:oligosaccharide repeat unit polymerase